MQYFMTLNASTGESHITPLVRNVEPKAGCGCPTAKQSPRSETSISPQLATMAELQADALRCAVGIRRCADEGDAGAVGAGVGVDARRTRTTRSCAPRDRWRPRRTRPVHRPGHAGRVEVNEACAAGASCGPGTGLVIRPPPAVAAKRWPVVPGRVARRLAELHGRCRPRALNPTPTGAVGRKRHGNGRDVPAGLLLITWKRRGQVHDHG